MRWVLILLVMAATLVPASVSAFDEPEDEGDDVPAAMQGRDRGPLEEDPDDPPPWIDPEPDRDERLAPDRDDDLDADLDRDREERREAFPPPPRRELERWRERERRRQAAPPREERRGTETPPSDVAVDALAGQLADQRRELRRISTQLEALIEALRQRRAQAAVPPKPAADPEHARILQSVDRSLKALARADTRIRNLEEQVWLTRLFGVLGPLLALMIGVAF